jgi:lipoprotein signal peptidase
MVLGSLALVIVLDQVTKWWAWREDPTAHINFGGNPFVGATVGSWYAHPVTGALLDLLGAGVLSVAVLVLLRYRQSIVVRTAAALAVGGWSSNLLDRLGMHYVTAPGSVRGAVDFIHIGDYYVNIADFFIVGATLVFLLALRYRRATTSLVVTPGTPHRLRVPTGVVAASVVSVVFAVALGAANYGGIIAPSGGL